MDSSDDSDTKYTDLYKRQEYPRYSRFVNWNDELARVVTGWPVEGNRWGLTLYLPGLRHILWNVLDNGCDRALAVRRYRDAIGLEGEETYNVLTDIATTFQMLMHEVNATMAALAALDDRIHGRQDTPWRAIEYLFYPPGNEPRRQGMFHQVHGRIQETDMDIPDNAMNDFMRLIDENRKVERSLIKVKEYGMDCIDHFRANDVTLDDSGRRPDDWSTDREETDAEEDDEDSLCSVM